MVIPRIENNVLILNGQKSGVTFDVEIPKGVSVFDGDSGVGKSFLFRKLMNLSGIPECPYTARLFDYHNFDDSAEQFITSAINKSVVMFDNADMYLTPFIINAVRKSSTFILVAARGLDFVDNSALSFMDINFMDISFDLHRLVVTRGGVSGGNDI